MRRVVIYPGRIAVEEADVPAPGPNEALVRTLAAGVCGSDLHAAHGRHPFVSMPYRPGHEVVGVIEAVGSAVDARTPGQRVIVEPYLPCWTCKMCTSGRENLCENLQFFGCGYRQGGMADYFTLAANRLHPVPDDLDDHSAALIEPLSTPVHAVRLAGDVTGRAVAVLGAGTIGLFTVAVLRAHGAGRVVSTDPNAAKRERAAALGAHATIDARMPDVTAQVRQALGGSADLVFDCVAIQSSIDQAIAMADKGGTVMVVGVPAREVTVPLPIVQDHQIRIQGSATYLPEDYQESAGLLGRGAVRTADFVTATRPLAQVAEAFELASSGSHVKVLLTVASGDPGHGRARCRPAIGTGGPRFRRHSRRDIAAPRRRQPAGRRRPAAARRAGHRGGPRHRDRADRGFAAPRQRLRCDTGHRHLRHPRRAAVAGRTAARASAAGGPGGAAREPARAPGRPRA